MKRVILLLSLGIVAAVGASVFVFQEETETQDNSESIPVYTPEKNSEPASISTIAKSAEEQESDPVYRYRVALTTTMSNPKTQLGEMTYRFNMALKPTDDQPNVYLGQIYNIQLTP